MTVDPVPLYTSAWIRVNRLSEPAGPGPRGSGSGGGGTCSRSILSVAQLPRSGGFLVHGTRLTALAVYLLCATATSAGSATYYVSLAGIDGKNCGLTAAAACRSIQFAYANRAAAGDTIQVAPGVYTECIGGSAAFGDRPGPKPVKFVAATFATSGDIGATAIAGAGVCGPESKNPGPVVALAGAGASLVGFTVTGGGDSGIRARGPVTIENNIIAMSASPESGGGIRWEAATCEFGDVEATIARNQVRMNRAGGDGGGIHAVAAGAAPGEGCVGGTAEVTLSKNIVEWNDADGFRGGGIAVRAVSIAENEATVVASENRVVGNRILGPGTARGGGIWVEGSADGEASIDVEFNTVRLNSSTGSGAGVAVEVAGNDGLVPGASGTNAITLTGNTIESNEAAGPAGAGVFVEPATSVGASAHITIVSNRIVGNRFAAGVIGDGGGLWAGAAGEGEETIEVEFNEMSFNTASRSGGGAFVAVAAAESSAHSAVVDRNTFSGNVASANAGGIQISVTSPDGRTFQPATARLSNNLIRRNESRTEDRDRTLGGGGALATLDVAGGDGSASVQIAGNTFSENRSSRAGGGLSLHSRVTVDGTGGEPLVARISTSNNLFAGNLVNDGVGGAVYALLESTGATRAEATIDLSTFSANRAAAGGAGVEVESLTGSVAFGSAASGAALATISHSIFDRNSGFAIGGPQPGSPGLFGGGDGNLRVESIANDFFGNTAGPFEPTLLDPAPPPPEPPALRETGTLDLDAQLDDEFDHELCIRIGRASPSSLSDVNGDAIVDGIDIARVAEAFGSFAENGRFSALADIDGNAIVDGDDLAIVVGALADTCPEE